ncbi:MAG: indolepyruvate ferredoxin oxidoreductase [Elusimicrobia bacterium CG_4_10_14_0_2_um_filter_56_8]|nr:MAG: indolepyruvate ferredoxin oxidoreductase [Elusimicrobia bacterium CG1_02_56_21]PJA14976.1 MAG: indolepyruvate ferredoxin oxidoreductase [Elusimicrobia bacterium CG_4_10_14_0_2_um_filter_56_8]
MLSLMELMTVKEGFGALVMGNHALARAMAEAGTAVVTSYPGSPTTEIAEALQAPPENSRPCHFEFAVNEKVALELAAGASVNGHASAVFFKSVGLNVAADSLVQLALMELMGGMVVILGDDPGANSSQNEQDNRWFARMAYIPVFEPASPAEIYVMYKEAAALARQRRAPVFLRLTTHVCHAREKVQFGALPDQPAWVPRFKSENGPYVPIAASVFPLKQRALEKLEAWSDYGEKSAVNSVFKASVPGAKRLGAIAAGLPALCLLEAVRAAGAPVDLLKLGMTYPLPARLLSEFMRSHDEVYILEELDRVMETELKALAYDRGLGCRIHSRRGSAELMGEMTPERARAALAVPWPSLFPSMSRTVHPEPAHRTPQMCPGCGHRSAFHAVKKNLPPGAITVGDIGCHSLGFLRPYNMGEILFSMGHSVSTASGLALNNSSRKVVAFVGDSTFFHAGLPGVVNAAARNSDITLILLDNGTTAMTGHQSRPGNGEIGERLSLAEILKSLGVAFLRECDAYDQAKLGVCLKEATEHKGFAVIIARHPCMLKFMREKRRSNPAAKKQRVAVDHKKCIWHYICAAEFACPSFVRDPDGFITVNPELCIGDGSCIQTCPEQAIAINKEPEFYIKPLSEEGGEDGF